MTHMPLVGISVGWGTLYLYELVGETFYLYVGRRTCIQRTLVRRIDDWTKDVDCPQHKLNKNQLLKITQAFVVYSFKINLQAIE